MNYRLLSLLLFFLFIFSSPEKLLPFDVEKIKEEITLELPKDLNITSQHKPILLLVGGYPGSGKTTLINALAQTHEMTVIAWNAIRQALLDRDLRGSPHDGEIIDTVNRNLFQKCLEGHANIVIDANAHGSNIQLFKELLEPYQDTYQMVTIWLSPSTETLFSRIRKREQKEGLHQGTETDLIRDLHSERKKMKKEDYSLIIKNDEISFETELKIVNALLQPYFDQQQQ